MNCCRRHAIFAPQSGKGYALGALNADGAYVVFREFCEVQIFTDWMKVSALCHLVGVIVSVRTKEQMIRIDARRVVAPMQHPQALWNWAIMQFVAVSMRSVHVAIDTELPIALGLAIFPFPALIGAASVNVTPETFNWATIVRNTKSIVMAFDEACLSARLLLNGDRLSATAFAKFWELVARGMILHVDTFLSRFGHAGGRCKRRSGASIGELNYTIGVA